MQSCMMFPDRLIALSGFVDGDGSGFRGDSHRVVCACVADHDQRTDKGRGQELLYGFANARLVVVDGQRHGDPFVWARVATDGFIEAFVREEDKKIERGRTDTERDRNAAVPDDPLAHRTKRLVETKQVARNDKPNAEKIHCDAKEKQKHRVHQEGRRGR
jgi:hypothetical protein